MRNRKKSFQDIIDNLSGAYFKHYFIIGVAVGVLFFFILTVIKPNLWAVWLFSGIFFGWIHGYWIGTPLLGVCYVFAFVLYPLIWCINKDYARDFYIGINTKDAIQCIIFTLVFGVFFVGFIVNDGDNGTAPQRQSDYEYDGDYEYGYEEDYRFGRPGH